MSALNGESDETINTSCTILHIRIKMHPQDSHQPADDFNLSQDQQQALEEMLTFVESSEDCFILKGAAGSGKTYLLSAFLYALNRTNTPFRLMAPTGRAARIIRSKTGHSAKTIHSSIYGAGKIVDCEDDDVFKLSFEIKTSKEPDGTVFITDEASMISDVAHEKENSHLQFGSGKLLTDLLKYAKSGPREKKSKFIFVGDPYQLPPVGSNNSPALDETYLYEQSGLIVRSTELNTVVRQQAGSGILQVANRIRQSLDHNLYNALDLKADGEDVGELEDENVETRYEYFWGTHREEVILIVPTNALVQSYNHRLRSCLFPSASSAIVPGDRIIVTQNNRKYDLLNGDFVTVVDCNADTQTVWALKDIRLVFRDIKVKTEDGRDPFWCKILENHLLSDEGPTSPETMQALWVDFKRRHKDLSPKDPAFGDALQEDLFFNALRVKHGYAITCHKSQGGEWNQVLVVFDETQGKNNKSFYRWTYTAITRAKLQLMTIDAPSFSFTSKLEFAERAQVTHSTNHKTLNVGAIKEVLAYERIDVDIKPMQYRYRLIISRNDASTTVDLIFNKKNIITNISILQASGDDENEAQKISADMKRLTKEWEGNRLEGGSSSSDQTSAPSQSPEPIKVPVFPEDKPFLKELYEKLTTQLKPMGVIVQSVGHYEWHERYQFFSEAGSLDVDFYFNKKGVFTRINPLPNGSAEIFQIIQGALNGNLSA